MTGQFDDFDAQIQCEEQQPNAFHDLEVSRLQAQHVTDFVLAGGEIVPDTNAPDCKFAGEVG